MLEVPHVAREMEIVVTLQVGTFLDVLVVTELGFATGSTSSAVSGLDLTTQFFDIVMLSDILPADEVVIKLGVTVNQDLTIGL